MTTTTTTTNSTGSLPFDASTDVFDSLVVQWSHNSRKQPSLGIMTTSRLYREAAAAAAATTTATPVSGSWPEARRALHRHYQQQQSRREDNPAAIHCIVTQNRERVDGRTVPFGGYHQDVIHDDENNEQELIPCTVLTLSSKAASTAPTANLNSSTELFLYALTKKYHPTNENGDQDDSITTLQELLREAHQREALLWSDEIRKNGTAAVRIMTNNRRENASPTDTSTAALIRSPPPPLPSSTSLLSTLSTTEQSTVPTGVAAVTTKLLAPIGITRSSSQPPSTLSSSFFSSSRPSKSTSYPVNATFPNTNPTSATKTTMISSSTLTKKHPPDESRSDQKENCHDVVMMETTNVSHETKTTKSSIQIGNADDFVGDIDEDGDEDDPVVTATDFAKSKPLPKIRVGRAGRGMTARSVLDDMVDDSDDEDQDPRMTSTNNNRNKVTTGAIVDAFAQVFSHDGQPSSSSTNNEQRKKTVLETVTFTDEKGYMRTETRQIEVDCDNNGDTEPTQPPVGVTAPMHVQRPSSSSSSNTTQQPTATRNTKRAATVVNKSQLKQGSINSFFGKKSG